MDPPDTHVKRDRGPTTWVDPEDNDFLDFDPSKELIDIPQNTLDGGEATGLLARVEQLVGAEQLNDTFEKFDQAKKTGIVTGSIDLQSPEFDASNFLFFVFHNSDFDTMQNFLRELEEEQTVDPQEVKGLVKAMLPRFIASKDAVDRLNSDTNDFSSVETLEGIYAELATACQSVFQPLIDRSKEIETLKSVIEVVGQCRPLLLLPTTMRDSIQREEYETVVTSYKKSKDMCVNWLASRGTDPINQMLVREVLREVEVLRTACRDSLLAQLTSDHASPEDVSRAIGYLRLLGEKDQLTAHITCLNWHIRKIETAIEEINTDYLEKMAVSSPRDGDSLLGEDPVVASEIMHKLVQTVQRRVLQFHRLVLVVTSHSSSKSRKSKRGSGEAVDSAERYVSAVGRACLILKTIFRNTFSRHAPQENSDIFVADGALSVLRRVKTLLKVFTENSLPQAAIDLISSSWTFLAKICVTVGFSQVRFDVLQPTQLFSAGDTSSYFEASITSSVDRIVSRVEACVRFLVARILGDEMETHRARVGLKEAEIHSLLDDLWAHSIEIFLVALDALHSSVFATKVNGSGLKFRGAHIVCAVTSLITQNAFSHLTSLFQTLDPCYGPTSLVCTSSLNTLRSSASCLQKLCFNFLLKSFSMEIKKTIRWAFSSSATHDGSVHSGVSDLLNILAEGHHDLRHSPPLQAQFVVASFEGIFVSALAELKDLVALSTAESPDAVMSAAMSIETQIAFLSMISAATLSPLSIRLMQNIRALLYEWVGARTEDDRSQLEDRFKNYSREGVRKGMHKSRMVIESFRADTT